MNEYKLGSELAQKVGLEKISSLLDTDHLQTQLVEIFEKRHYSKGIWKENMTIIDAGANMGLASLFFRDHAKIIYALEPNPGHYKTLVINTQNYPKIKTFELALGDGTQEMTLKSNDDGTVPESVFGNGKNEVKVKSVGIDDFMEEQGIDEVDLLKIDIEGGEYLVFQSAGFEKMAPKIKVIIGESHYFGLLRSSLIPVILKEYGYKTKFLNFYNLEDTINIVNKITGREKKYRVPLKTLFIAQR